MVSESVRVIMADFVDGDAQSQSIAGWYDLNYDEELGRQPCIFRSVTPVSVPLLFENQPINNRDRLGTMRTFQDLRIR